jgi:plasmid maintenance system antidote protein VapI
MTLAEFLDANNIDRKAAQASLDVSESYISRLINRVCDPSFDIALKLDIFSGGKISIREMARVGNPRTAA